MMIDVEEADLMVIALENHNEGVDKFQSLYPYRFGIEKEFISVFKTCLCKAV